MSPRSRSVLIVDDDRDVRDAMAELLEDDGYECFRARDGAEALAILKVERPGLMLVDLIMPLMNGAHLLSLLHDDPSYRDIPVIAMTAADDRMVGVQLDVPVLRKPIDLTVLSRLLAQHYSRGPDPAQAPI
jgi:two-component system, chemotaxis family, chemotaxis protein CheY